MVPRGWTERKLGTVIDIKHGFAFDSDHFNTAGRGTKLLTPAHFLEEGGFKDVGQKQKYYDGPVPNGYLLCGGELLVAMTEQAPGLLGSPVLVPQESTFLHNQRLGLVQVIKSEAVRPEFLFHVFNMPQVRRTISSTAGGTKVRHSSPDKIKAVSWMFPSLVEQERIATYLADWAEIARSIGTLLTAKKALRDATVADVLSGKRRFQDFISSTSKRTARFCSIPQDWSYPSVGLIAAEVSERNRSWNGYPVLSCTKHRGLVESLEYFGKRVFAEDTSNYKIVRRGQFAYATNHIEEGSIGLLSTHDAGLISPIYTVFETDPSKVHAPFLFRLFKTELYRHIFEVNTNASVDRRGSLRWSQFATIHVPLPSREEQCRIADALDTVDREIELLTQEAEALKLQKKGLMQKLLTGQIRVKT